MLEEESEHFITSPIYEVDIEHHKHIADAYGIAVVPTLISGNHSISGLPSSSDLRAFLMQSFSTLSPATHENNRGGVLGNLQQLLKEQRTIPNEELVSPLKN